MQSLLSSAKAMLDKCIASPCPLRAAPPPLLAHRGGSDSTELLQRPRRAQWRRRAAERRRLHLLKKHEREKREKVKEKRRKKTFDLLFGRPRPRNFQEESALPFFAAVFLSPSVLFESQKASQDELGCKAVRGGQAVEVREGASKSEGRRRRAASGEKRKERAAG